MILLEFINKFKIVDGLSAQNRVLISNHDAKVPFGMGIP